ncbi:uncharacterized protein TNCV_2940181 [Trichonephila clavipes]|nr:uncharacterized protein TNCV_2940181 [Trichonephila clavipes]
MSIFIDLLPPQAELKTIYHATYRKYVSLHLQRYHQFGGKQHHLKERFGAPVKLISDIGPQFISDIFERLNERLGIRHVKTVVYRPQANRTERVNHDLVQMIANYVNDQHDTGDQFLREFTYAIRTAVNETTGKTPAELFLVRKLTTPFRKLVMVSDGTEFAVGDIERLFEEARRNTKAKHEKW